MVEGDVIIRFIQDISLTYKEYLHYYSDKIMIWSLVSKMVALGVLSFLCRSSNAFSSHHFIHRGINSFHRRINAKLQMQGAMTEPVRVRFAPSPTGMRACTRIITLPLDFN
jgi:hypothetical protein